MHLVCVSLQKPRSHRYDYVNHACNKQITEQILLSYTQHNNILSQYYCNQVGNLAHTYFCHSRVTDSFVNQKGQVYQNIYGFQKIIFINILLSIILSSNDIDYGRPTIVSLLIFSDISTGTVIMFMCVFILYMLYFCPHFVWQTLSQTFLTQEMFSFSWFIQINQLCVIIIKQCFHIIELDHINCKVYVVTYVCILNNKSKNQVIRKNNITYLQCIILNLVMTQFLKYFFQNAF